MRPGERIAGRWEILKRIGAGGMSEVFRARDLTSGEDVAIKLMHAVSAQVAARFEREARLLAELAHPAILRYLAHGELDTGRLYLVTEWLAGEDLSQRIRRQPLTLEESLDVVRQVAEALAPAHRRGIVHRDIKPPNVFLVDRELGRVKLLDFGVARIARATEVTTPGTAVGTPAYMSPEQATGQHSIDVRSDVYSLGCLLFKLVSGRTPFTGESIAVLAKIALEDAPLLSSAAPDVPRNVDALCARLLSRDPAGRPPDAAAVIDEVRALGTRVVPPSRRLGDEERWLVSLVLIRRAVSPSISGSTPEVRDATSAETSSDAKTGPMDEHATRKWRDPREVAIRKIAKNEGARMLRLADGSVVLTITGGDVATDLASRAARVALALASEIPSRPIALATGMSATGDVTTVGEVIDRASSAVERAGDTPGILLDDVSAALIEHRFVIERRGEVAFVVREREAVDAPRQLLGRPAAFVGRRREISMIEACYRDSVEQGHSSAVLVTAMAGAGKTRLRHELVERLGGAGARQHRRSIASSSDPAAQRREPELLESSGDPSRAGSAFSMIASALRWRFGVHPGDKKLRQHAKLVTVLSDVLPEHDRDRVVTFLAELIGAPFSDKDDVQLRAARQSPMLMGDQIRRAFEDYLFAVTEARPVLLMLDDLQWCDLPSVKLVESALLSLRDRPLFVVAFAREEARQAFPGLFSGARVSHVPLGPLSKRTCEKIARDALGASIAEAEVARIVAHSTGNPFFLEELLRSAAEGRLAALPATVMATLQSRLRSLESDARRILRAAAIFGTSFWSGGVRALLGGEDELEAVDAWLEYLAEREWIMERPSSTVEDEREWAFTHIPACDAVYATITESDRKDGHLLAAEWLEAHRAADAIVMAEHFERGGDRARAVPHFVQAARSSLEGNDLEGALARARRGIGCAEAASLREASGMLHLVSAEAHRWRGENGAAARAALAALERLPKKSAPWFLALAESATAHGRIDDPDRLLEMVSFFDLPDDPAAVDAFCMAASRATISLSHRGFHREADRVLDAAERASARHGTRGPQGLAAIAVGRNSQAHSLMRPAAALAWALHAVAELDRLGDRRTACMQRVNVGWSYIVLGCYADAEQWLRAALDTASSLHLEDSTAMARQNLGLALTLSGQAEEAVLVLRAAVDMFARQQNRLMLGVAYNYLAGALEAAGDLDAAERESDRALELFANMPSMRCVGLARRASIARRRGDRAAANEAAFAAMASLKEAGRVSEGEAQVVLEHAIALLDTGEKDRAARELAGLRARILECAREIEDPVLKDAFLRSVEEHARALAMTGGK